MNAAERFREAATRMDPDAMAATLAADVRLHSPTHPTAVEGRERVRMIFGILVELFEDFEYTQVVAGADGAHVLVFRCRVGTETIEGIDLLDLDANDEIATFKVFIRPLPGLEALAEAIAARLGSAPRPG